MPDLKAAALGNVNLSDLESHIVMLDFACVRRKWFFSRFLCFFPDRKSTRLNSSHLVISYAVFCLKKKKQHEIHIADGRVHESHPARSVAWNALLSTCVAG